jgi:uncharacterized protein with ParB-like and HNH nuclease domain
MQKKVDTRVQALADVWRDNIAFVVPSYQRPYVWPAEDVLKLVDDIIRAHQSGDSTYYIGTVLSAASGPQQCPVHELIDGQQRITTLMLVALAFLRCKVGDCMLSRVATLNSRPRLTFAIRDQVQALLGYWAGIPDYQFPGDEAVGSNPYLTRLDGALRVLEQKVKALIDASPAACGKIADFIFSQVKWVNNVMPAGMDLNLLFATMNTAGVQLEQTDILKSYLIRGIKNDKLRYEAIWLACGHMESYFERNVRRLFPGTNWEAIQAEDLAAFDPNRFLLSGDSLSAPEQSVPDDEEPVYCRSIISFPLLLMHAYRVHLGLKGDDDIEKTLHADRLIECFKPLTIAPEDEIKAFFHLLWQVRYQFDSWVVKWVERADDDKEVLLLTSVYRSQSNLKQFNRRADAVSELVMLQSVRFFTGERTAQYWLTPFLGWLIRSACTDKTLVLGELERIDNQLSLVEIAQKQASFALLSEKMPQLKSVETIRSYLSGAKSTGFEHYWFQKVEYLLWKRRSTYSWLNAGKLAGYRITSKSSVEHVHPQKEENNKQLPEQYLHSFGNLVLLSPGQNSSYSNQKVAKKQIDFNSKQVYDSLKLAHIFSLVTARNNEWEENGIEVHRQEMLKLIEGHYHDAQQE